MPTPIPCPECGAPPHTRPARNPDQKGRWVAECSRGFLCDHGPITSPKATREEARQAWQNREGFPAEETSS